MSIVDFEQVNVSGALCFMYDDDVSEVLTPNSLLFGRKLEFENNCVDEADRGICDRGTLE